MRAYKLAFNICRINSMWLLGCEDFRPRDIKYNQFFVFFHSLIKSIGHTSFKPHNKKFYFYFPFFLIYFSFFFFNLTKREKGQVPLDCEQKQFSGKYRFYKNWWLQLIRKTVGCPRFELEDTWSNKLCMPWKVKREEKNFNVSKMLWKVWHWWNFHLHSIFALMGFFFPP